MTSDSSFSFAASLSSFFSLLYIVEKRWQTKLIFVKRVNNKSISFIMDCSFCFTRFSKLLFFFSFFFSRTTSIHLFLFIVQYNRNNKRIERERDICISSYVLPTLYIKLIGDILFYSDSSVHLPPSYNKPRLRFIPTVVYLYCGGSLVTFAYNTFKLLLDIST